MSIVLVPLLEMIGAGILALPEAISWIVVAVIFGAEGAATIFRYGRERRRRALFSELRGNWYYKCDIVEQIPGDRAHGGKCCFTLEEEEFCVKLVVLGDRTWTAPSLAAGKVDCEAVHWRGDGVVESSARLAYHYYTALEGERHGFTKLNVERDQSGKLTELRGEYTLIIPPNQLAAQTNSLNVVPVLHGLVTMVR
ncbi:MAG TPA: hypothetical protein VEX43_04840 [Chthoniobacterales bacterium]|nr:hypothetical protein [Chthoniobacterales bacterium]